eukprot:1122082-Prymnesium_polylepis.1
MAPFRCEPTHRLSDARVAERHDRMCPRAARAHKLQERGLSCMRLQRVMVVQRTYAPTSDVR